MFLNVVFFNSLLLTVAFLCHQKISENQMYSDVSSGYKKVALSSAGLAKIFMTVFLSQALE